MIARRLFPLPLFILLALGVLAVVGCGGDPEAAESAAESSSSRADGQAAGDAGTVAVETLVVEPRSAVETASLPADLRARRRATLAAEVAGTVESLRVDDGDTVRAGQVLAEVDTRALEARLDEANAVDEQRRIQFERAEKLLEKRSITRVQFLDAKTARDVAAAQLASAELELAKATLRAPWAGTVAATRIEEGDYVRPGEPMVEIVDLSRLEVTAPAPAADVPFLRLGTPAEVQVDVFPGETFRGEVTRLGAELDPGTRTLEVVVALPDPDPRLRPGLSARVEWPRRTLDDAIVVPISATVELADSRAVFVVEDGRAARRRVTLGPVVGDGDEVVVEDGLASGDRLVVRGQRRLGPGQRVEALDQALEPGLEPGAEPR